MSDELESIGISIILDDKVADGMRRISRDMSLFSRQTELTAAQMSRIARLHLDPYLPPEPVRPRPVAAVVTNAPRKAQTMPTTEAPQEPRLKLPPAAAIPSPPRSPMQQEPAFAAVAPRAMLPPARPSAPVPPPAARSAPVVQQAALPGRPASAGHRVLHPPRPEPPMQTPRELLAAQIVPPRPRSEPTIQQVQPLPRMEPAPVAPASPASPAVIPPERAIDAPHVHPQDKHASRPTIRVALSAPSPTPPPATAAPVAAVETAPVQAAPHTNPTPTPAPPIVRPATSLVRGQAAQTQSVANAHSPAPPQTTTTSNVVVARRSPLAGPALPPAVTAHPASPAPAVLPPMAPAPPPAPAPATRVSRGLPFKHVAPPTNKPMALESGRSPVPPLPSAPALPNLTQSTRTSSSAAATDASPAPAQAQFAPMQGDVMLDGAQVGRWISSVMAREAARPPTAARGFNTRMTPAWPGSPL